MLAFIILCMIISPLMSIPILCIGVYYNRNTLSKGYAVPFALLYGMMGYSLRFRYDMDLVRYYAVVDRMAGQRLSYILSREQQGQYVQDILFFLVSRTGNNNILGFIVGFCCYLIIFYVFFDVVQRYRNPAKYNCNLHIFMIGFVMVSIVSPMNIISNVRCVFAYLLISLAVYREWIQKKRNIGTWLLYIIPLGLHISAVIVLAMRICTPLLKRFAKLFIFVAILLPLLIEFAYGRINIIGLNDTIFYYIRNVINKAYFYLNWTEGGWADQVKNSRSNMITRIYGVFFLIMMIIFYFTNKKSEKNTASGKMYDYLYIMSVVALGTLCIVTGVFWRFEAIVVLFSPVILMPIAMKEGKKNKYLLVIIYLSACVMNIFNVSGFINNIMLHDFFIECINTSIIKIIWELIRGFIVTLRG